MKHDSKPPPAERRPGLADYAWLPLVALFIAAVLAVWGWWLPPR